MMDLHECWTFGNTTRTHQGAEDPPRELPSLPGLTLRCLFARCDRFLEAPPCHMLERKLHVKASAKRVQDLEKGDIIGGGDLHIGVDGEII